MIGRTASTARPSFQLIDSSSDAGADDQEHRRDERRDRLRDEHLDRVDVRGQVRQQRGGRDLLDVGVILRRDLVDQPRPQVPRDALGRERLHHVLEVGEHEDAERDDATAR